MTIVKFNDLKAQWDLIKDSALPRLNNIFDTCSYILGPDVKTFEENFAEYIGATHAIGVASGLDALKIATLCFDEYINSSVSVYIPSNTFIATALGVEDALKLMNCQYQIHLIDCDEFYQMDMKKLNEALEKNQAKTEHILVVPVHLYGHSCNMELLYKLKDRYRFKILEDSSQAHGTEYAPDKKVGSCDKTDISAFSLYPGKNLGALGDAGVITTHNEKYADRCQYLRNYGAKIKYHHEYFGFNSRLDSIQAVMVDEKLKFLDEWNGLKNKIAEKYEDALSKIEELDFPEKAPYCHKHSYHLYVIRVPASLRVSLQKHLANSNIQSGMHYPIPIEKTGVYQDCGWNSPVTLKYSEEIVSLPIHPFMTDNEVSRVIDCIQDFFNNEV